MWEETSIKIIIIIIITATMYPLGTWFVLGICVWLPCIKDTMIIIVIIYLTANGLSPGSSGYNACT